MSTNADLIRQVQSTGGIVTALACTTFLGDIVIGLAIAFGWEGKELAKDFLEKISKQREKRDGEKDQISHI